MMTTKTILTSLYNLADTYLFAGYVEEAIATLDRGRSVIETDPIEQIDKRDHASLLLYHGTMLNWQSFIGQDRFEDTMSILVRAKAIADELGDAQLQAKLLLQMGNAYDKRKLISDKGDFQTALVFAQQAKSKFEEANDEIGLGKAYFDLGLIHQRLEHKDEAVDHFSKALELAQTHNQKLDISFALRHRGFFHFLDGDMETAYHYASESLRLREEIGCRLLYSPAHHILGLMCNEVGKEAQALIHFEKGLELARSLHLKLFMLQPLFSLAEWYQNESNPAHARLYLNQALDIAREVNYQRAIEVATAKIEEIA